MLFSGQPQISQVTHFQSRFKHKPGSSFCAVATTSVERTMMTAVLLGLCLLLCCCTSVCIGSARYDAECDAIISHAKQAAYYHNQGQLDASEREHALAFEAFERAVTIDPHDPQAFANMAIYSYNSQRFDHCLEYWEQVLKRLSADDVQMHAVVAAKMRDCRFGRLSVNRDKAYNAGQGNITEALEWAQKQLAMIPSPETHSGIATMLLMKSETDPSLQATAHQHFEQAAHIAHRGFVAGARARGWRCTQSDRLYTGWRRRNMPPGTRVQRLDSEHKFSGSVRLLSPTPSEDDGVATQTYTQGTVWHITLPNAALFGNDGLIAPSPTHNTDCWLQLGSAGVYVNVLANVQVQPVWDEYSSGQFFDFSRGRLPNHGMQQPQQVPLLTSAATVVSYAVRSYFHFLTEALGRLLVLIDLTPETTPLVLPQDDTGNKFITQYLDLLPSTVAARVFPYDTKSGFNDIRLRIETLHIVDWQTTDDGSDVQTHALAPRWLLRRVRDTMTANDAVKAVLPSVHTHADRPLIIIASRKTERMRILDEEDALIGAIETAVGNHARVVVFRGQEMPIANTIALFSQADVVVGVHGGALANVIFCPSGAALFEIGFNTTHTQHYRHLALALDLSYSLSPLVPDERGVGRKRVALPDGAAARIVAGVTAHLNLPSHHDEL
ncbi:hypothetical protein PTSG_12129 [Salpingoeca rosetta]|uniref:Glycosyltransferase 61 catalytic domain-containing protein n=1 Tax=Salpingoeca rosetta (strain ATCC 50818 / BSB-021) TaxID=946362 RepID=F2U6N1_SALR5|nr:uncharacterized protein PTSG_12129 [Salpingoeca rosetta]EGD83513.1 hypothetical protein PTSG_12129 [Salpingoeca rosetta]|eukprot:XP_004995017.1 hypothetical protein PTSG_12129 [Salpingoeca rosetta]